MDMTARLQVDYTRGQLPELIDVIIEEKARLFVSAVGVPPREVIDKLHKAGILVMNVTLFSLSPPSSPSLITNLPSQLSLR
jgi:NAD(P)H-dependent flavin oxidoreductase YrpB (nitropropane dioxygenase family)